jgi:hypothetical protein
MLFHIPDSAFVEFTTSNVTQNGPICDLGCFLYIGNNFDKQNIKSLSLKQLGPYVLGIYSVSTKVWEI